MSLQSLALIENWPVPTAAAAVVRADGTVLGTHGPTGHRFPLASVTKPLAAYAALVAYEEGAIELDEPAGPPGATVRHLLAHTSGLAFDEHRVTSPARPAPPVLERGLRAARRPRGEGDGDPVRGVPAPGGPRPPRHDVDLAGRLPREGRRLDGRRPRPLRRRTPGPRLLDPRTVAEAMTVQYPGTKGVLPGYGHQNPNDWGLGLEIRDSKSPIGRAVRPPRAPSATSASRARSCGSTRPRARPASPWRTGRSAPGRSRRGRRSRTRCWPRSEHSSPVTCRAR